MTKIRNITAVLLALSMLLPLCACGEKGGDEISTNTTESAEIIPDNVMPDNYRITYNVTEYSSTTAIDNVYPLTVAHKDGNIYMKDTGNYQMLFVPSENSEYELYENVGAGFADSGLSLGYDMVEQLLGRVTSLYTFYSDYLANCEKTGSETIMGKECIIYSFTSEYAATTGGSLSFWIDGNSGLCMKMTSTGKINSGLAAFELTEYSTENYEFPEI